MRPEPKRIRELFVAAVGKADPELRDAFLAGACDGDEGLLREVRLLLEAHEDAGRFLESPAAAPTITVDSRMVMEVRKQHLPRSQLQRVPLVDTTCRICRRIR